MALGKRNQKSNMSSHLQINGPKNMLESIDMYTQVVHSEFITLQSKKKRIWYEQLLLLHPPTGARWKCRPADDCYKVLYVSEIKGWKAPARFDGNKFLEQWNWLRLDYLFLFYKQQSTSECSVHSGMTEVEQTERLFILRVRIRRSGLPPLEVPLPPLASREVRPRNLDVVVDPLAVRLTSCRSCWCAFRETPAPMPTERSFKLYWLLNWRQW
jgi:hypothetical protein